MKHIASKYWLTGITAILLFYLSACTCNRQTPEQQDATNYIYYLGQSPATSLGDAKKAASTLLANNAALPGKFTDSTGDGNVYYSDENDPTVRFQQDPKTGSFSFSNSLKSYLDNSTPKLPSKQEAVSVAKDYLNKYRLMPADEAQLQVTHIGGVKSSAVINGNTRGPEIDKMRTVVFTRTIDSASVVGAGSKVVVQLGNNNELLGMTYRWKNISKSQPRKFVPLVGQITLEEAQKQAQQRIISEFGEDARYQFISAKKVLYDGNGNIIQPVYAFEAAISARIGKEQEGQYQYLYLIQALKDSPEPVTIANVPPEAGRLINTVKMNPNAHPGDNKERE